MSEGDGGNGVRTHRASGTLYYAYFLAFEDFIKVTHEVELDLVRLRVGEGGKLGGGRENEGRFGVGRHVLQSLKAEKDAYMR